MYILMTMCSQSILSCIRIISLVVTAVAYSRGFYGLKARLHRLPFSVVTLVTCVPVVPAGHSSTYASISLSSLKQAGLPLTQPIHRIKFEIPKFILNSMTARQHDVQVKL